MKDDWGRTIFKANYVPGMSVFARGSTGNVAIMKDGHVRKFLRFQETYPEAMFQCLKTEYEIYRRLGPHARLVPLINFTTNGPAPGLTLAYMPKGTLKDRLSAQPPSTAAQRHQWAQDVIESVKLLHSHGIVHCDIQPGNFLLDGDDRLRIIDFMGSSMDGEAPWVCESPAFFMPHTDAEYRSYTTDMFAMGSTLYQVMTGHRPYPDFEDEEVEARYERGEFPSVEGLTCGLSISKCWQGGFPSIDDAQASFLEETGYLI